MIPRIIHQTWRDERIPVRFGEYAASWRQQNPDWRTILWTDRMLLDFVEEHYPELLGVYCAYARPVQRADAARYMLLHRFGGVYADLDTESLAQFDALVEENRVVLCHEPPSHWPTHAPFRSHPFILFNGVIASPAGHDFWRRVLDRLPETAAATDVVDATGPCFLTGLYLGFDRRDTIRVESCHLFTPTDRDGAQAPDYGGTAVMPLARHDWAATWWDQKRRR